MSAISLSGKLDGQDTAAWTAVQVADRAGHSLSDICAEWTGSAEAFDAALGWPDPAHMPAFDFAEADLLEPA